MSRKVGGTLTQQQQYWLEQIRNCKSSGKSMKAYAAEQGLAIKSLYSWKKALVKKGVLPRTRQPQFHRVQVIEPERGSEWHIQLPNGVSVAFSGNVDAKILTIVLSPAAAAA